MKIAKQRYFKKIPEAWKILCNSKTDKWTEVDLGPVVNGYYYCPYIPLLNSKMINT